MTAGADCKNLFEDPFRRRDPARDAAKKSRLSAAKPKQLGRPEGGAEHAPGPLLEGALIKCFAETCRILSTARVCPGEDWGERFSGAIDPEQTVPEAGAADGIDRILRQATGLAQTLSGGTQENLRIEFCGVLGRMADPIDLPGVGTGDGLRISIEERGPDGRSANVDGQNDRFDRAATHDQLNSFQALGFKFKWRKRVAKNHFSELEP